MSALNPVYITARDLPEAWWLCLKNLFESGRKYRISRGSAGKIERLEFDFVVVRILYPGNRPLVPDTPEGVPPPASIEEIEKNYIFSLMTSLEKDKGYDYTYGEFLEKQIEFVIDYYKEHGAETNHCCMTIGTPETIFAYKTPGKTTPCLKVVDTRIKDGKLHFPMVYFRSWDLWAGFPVNLAGLQLMKEFMAEAIGVEDGEMIVASKGLHLYDYQWELAKMVLRL